MNFAEMRQQAKEQRSEQQYQKAIELYKRVWEEYPEQCDKWVGWEYADCLYKVKDYSEALAICRVVYKQVNDFSYTNTIYARCIYQMEIKVSEVQNQHRFLKAAKAITELTVQDQYSPYVQTIFKVLEYHKKKNHYGEMIGWLEKLDAVRLNRSSIRFTDNDGNERELASEWENYYAMHAKALFMEKRFEECKRVSEQALTSISSFHYNNDIWFKRYIAKSYEALGDYQRALDLLKDILCRKKEWFIYGDLSHLYYIQKVYKEAMLFGMKAALGAKLMLSTDLLLRLADLFDRDEKSDWAARHIELACALQLSKVPRLDSRLAGFAHQYQIDVNQTKDVNGLLCTMQQEWQKRINEMRELQRGEVAKIIMEGRAGFIKAEDGNSYYFKSKSFRGRPGTLGLGLKVQFYIEESFDGKKNQVSYEAIDIRKSEEHVGR